MGWSVIIDEGAAARTIDANMRFDSAFKANTNENGDIESVDYLFDVEGILVDPTPATVGANLVTYSELVTEQTLAVRVQIKQDGTTRFDLKPEDGFDGPYVTEFRSLGREEGGSGKGHWRYAFTIAFKGKGNASGGGETLYEFQTSLAVTKKNGKVVRKVWKVTSKSTSVASALSAVMGFRPAEKYTIEDTERFPQDKRATGVWIWEADTKGVKSWVCRVTWKPGKGFIDRPSAGNADPVLYAKQRSASIAEVEGTIISYDPAMQPPGEHFTESETMRRCPDMERRGEGPVINGDPRNGEYRLDYHEVWKSTQGEPSSKHSDNHNLISLGSAPGDGAVSG